MTFEQAIRTCLNKYIDIEGRAPRSEYWWWVLFNIIVSIFAGLFDTMLGLGIISALASLALLAPNITVGVRRLHDQDKSGWWLLLLLIPFIGFIVLLIWFIQRGTDGPNRFGPDPLA